MIACIPFAESARILTLPGRRERGPTDVAAREKITPNRVAMLPPLPFAGVGWGGGVSAGTDFENSTAGAAS